MSRTAPSPEAYRARFRRVLDYVDRHLEDGDLSLERVSAVAAFSKYHFHRQFSALYGVGIARYVQLVRLRRAAYRLAFRTGERILDIALASGYESHEAFARAFKRLVDQTPSEFRERPDWRRWHERIETITRMRTESMTNDPETRDVRIVDFPETRVAAFEYRGDPALLNDAIRTFIEWRKANALPPRVSATYNIVYDDPETTPPEEFRFDVCAATDRPVAENPHGVVAKRIEGGRCAVLRHVGSSDAIGASVTYLYATWLPTSGEEPRDAPLFFQRVRMFPDVPEHEAVTDIFLPIV